MVLPVRGGALISPRWLGRFHLQAALGIKRRQVIEEDLVARDFRVFKIDGFNFNQREIAFAIFRRAHLAGDRVAGAEVELADLRRRDVNIVRAGEIVVFRSAQKSESIGETLEDAFGEDQTVLFGLRPEDLEDQLLLAHAARAGNVQFLGDLGEVGDVLFLQLGKADTHLIGSFNVCFFWHMSLAMIVKIDPENPDCF